MRLLSSLCLEQERGIFADFFFQVAAGHEFFPKLKRKAHSSKIRCSSVTKFRSRHQTPLWLTLHGQNMRLLYLQHGSPLSSGGNF